MYKYLLLKNSALKIFTDFLLNPFCLPKFFSSPSSQDCPKVTNPPRIWTSWLLGPWLDWWPFSRVQYTLYRYSVHLFSLPNKVPLFTKYKNLILRTQSESQVKNSIFDYLGSQSRWWEARWFETDWPTTLRMRHVCDSLRVAVMPWANASSKLMKASMAHKCMVSFLNNLLKDLFLRNEMYKNLAGFNVWL